MNILKEPVEPKNEIGTYEKKIQYRFNILDILSFLKNREADPKEAYILFSCPENEALTEGESPECSLYFHGKKMSEEEFVIAKAQYDIDIYKYNKWKLENGLAIEQFLNEERERKNKAYMGEIVRLEKEIEKFKNLIK